MNNEPCRNRMERDGQVFLYSIGYFYPMPTTEQYYEPDPEMLIRVIDWFLEQWRSDGS